MNQKLITIAQKIGMDKSIAYSSGSRIVQGLTGVLSIFFISTYLTGVEQGFYFTFGSILALQVFFELGLTGIMTQYVAHEAAHLSLEGFNFVGDEKYKSRLASLIHFCLKWYTILAIAVFVFILITGYIYFNNYGSKHSEVNWQAPWLIISFGTAIKLFQSPLNSIFMGLGKVKEISKIGFYQQLIIPISSWIGLALGLNLYVIGVSYLLSVIYWQLFVHFSKLDKIIFNLWNVNIQEKVSYLKEIFPYQWRIALSWISGYFIFQLFNPVLFAVEGPIVAGQMGLTMQALSSIQAFSLSWNNTKVPIYSHYIALGNYKELDNLFNKTFRQMLLVSFSLLVLFLLMVFCLQFWKISFKSTIIAHRFLDIDAIALLSITIIVNQCVNSWATYLRCHKKEPFLTNSVVLGFLCCFSTFFLGNIYGLYGIIFGYLGLSSLVSLPWGFYIFKSKKELWHLRIRNCSQ